MNFVQGNTTVIQCDLTIFTVELCEIGWKTTEELCGMFANHSRVCVECLIHRKNCVKPHPKESRRTPQRYIMGDTYRPKILGLITIKKFKQKGCFPLFRKHPPLFIFAYMLEN